MIWLQFTSFDCSLFSSSSPNVRLDLFGGFYPKSTIRSMLFYVNRDRTHRLLGTGSPGRPLRLSHSSWSLRRSHSSWALSFYTAPELWAFTQLLSSETFTQLLSSGLSHSSWALSFHTAPEHWDFHTAPELWDLTQLLSSETFTQLLNSEAFTQLLSTETFTQLLSSETFTQRLSSELSHISWVLRLSHSTWALKSASLLPWCYAALAWGWKNMAASLGVLAWHIICDDLIGWSAWVSMTCRRVHSLYVYCTMCRQPLHLNCHQDPSL